MAEGRLGREPGRGKRPSVRLRGTTLGPYASPAENADDRTAPITMPRRLAALSIRLGLEDRRRAERRAPVRDLSEGHPLLATWLVNVAAPLAWEAKTMIIPTKNLIASR